MLCNILYNTDRLLQNRTVTLHNLHSFLSTAALIATERYISSANQQQFVSNVLWQIFLHLVGALLPPVNE